MAGRRTAITLAALGLFLAGCGSSSGTASHSGSPTSGGTTPTGGPASVAAAHSWTRDRLKAAIDRHAGTSTTARPTTLNSLVGAVFTHATDGDHFCTASVVDSTAHNLILTAAHCLYDPGSGARTDLVFVPGYRNGEAPHGVWPIQTVTVDPSWQSAGNPDMDVAFATVEPQSGRQVEQVLGANRLGTDKGYQLPVRLTGYPSSQDEPITCVNMTAQQSPTQLRIDCQNYTGGTSGSPFVTALDPTTRTGTVVGVIGGYQQGGDTADTSYSSYFGDQVQALYAKATG